MTLLLNPAITKVMDKGQSLWIYDRREVVILLMLALCVAFFAFTLGVHLGKNSGVQVGVESEHGAVRDKLVETVQDEVPNRQEIDDQAKGLNTVIEDTLNQTLHDEVTRTGIKLDKPVQVELPEETKTASGGATTLETPKSIETSHQVIEFGTEESIQAMERPNPKGIYTIQVGSFPVFADAKLFVDALEALELKPFMRPANVGSKGKFYRIYVGGFSSKEEAEDVGKKHVSQHVIETFIVTKIP